MTTPLSEVVNYLDALLETREVPDYPGAVNGLQFENGGTVRKIAAAVDFSSRAIDGAVAADANLLLVHHGMFWGGVAPVVGVTRDRIRRLIDHDIAVYSSHLPLDRHPGLGNNALLAKELGLEPTHPFGSYKGVSVGVRGLCNITAQEMLGRVREFSRARGGDTIAVGTSSRSSLTSWAICTGAGASAETISEAIETGIDVLIVGEGPHWTAVEALDRGLMILYAGHYATETLGVTALAKNVAQQFSIEWTSIDAPTGL